MNATSPEQVRAPQHRILFVDDEPLVLSGLRRSLSSQRHEWEMSFVDSGAAALELMRAADYDAVVTDFRMPGMDGGGLLRAVKEQHPYAARLMLTGHTDSGELVGALKVAHRLLDKPCDRQVLVAAIEHLLTMRLTVVGGEGGVRAELANLADLPFSGATLRRLDATLHRSGSSDGELAQVIQADVGLTITMLHLYNTSTSGSDALVTSVAHAVEAVGRPAMRALAVMHSLAGPTHQNGFMKSWFALVNAHASLCGQLARRLVTAEQADAAFCAGVVAEAGQLAFAACRPSRMLGIVSAGADLPGLLTELELVEFGMAHDEAGAYLLGLWGFPADIVHAVADHAGPLPAWREGPLALHEAVRVARGVAQHHGSMACLQAEDAHLDNWLLDPRCSPALAPQADCRPQPPGDPS